MKRALADAGWILFVGAFLSLLSVGCHQRIKLEEQIDQHEAFELDAGMRLVEDDHQQAHLEEHTVDTSAPAERVDEDFAPLPDGGVVLAHRTITRQGPRVIEAWQTVQVGADEHVDVDQHVSASGSADLHAKGASEKETDAGGFSLGLKLGALAVLALLVGAFLLYRKIRKAVPIP